MIVREIFRNLADVNSLVNGHMNNVDADEYEHGDSIIVIHDEIGVTNRQNEQMETKSLKQVESRVDGAMNETISIRNKDHRLVEGVVSSKNMHHHVIQENADTIVEYTEEPLLPLMDACAPLINIIQNLSFYVQAALNETPNQPPDGLTTNESAAIRLYTMEWNEPYSSLYSELNHTLKNSDRQALRPYFRYLKLLLTALVKLPCVPLQTVWRGVNKNLSKMFPPGTPVIWWAFSSCTTSLTVLENSIYLANSGERTLFSVEVINGRTVRAHSHFDYEDEILLLPGTYMEVQSQASPAPDLHIIHLRQIKPTMTLLELPFEDALLYPPVVQIVPWYEKKRTIGEISLLLALCLAGVIVGLVIGTRGLPPPKLCYTRRAGIKADLLWSFDCEDAREDLKGLNNGSGLNGISYSSPDFSGDGYALRLERKSSEHVRLPYSLNLTVNTSFTVSVWIFSTGSNPATILSDCNALNSVCVELYVDVGRIDAQTFLYNNQSSVSSVCFDGSQTNYQSSWQHLTFTLDNRLHLLTIYFNGKKAANGTFYPNYFAGNQTKINEATSIGLSSILTNPRPFDGLIDQLSISYYVKNDSDILNEATLLCYYTFENKNVSIDSGPNNIPAKSQNVYRLVSNQESTLLFNSSDSFFQSSGFTLLMANFYEFTVAFWLRPILLKSDKLDSATAVLQLASRVQGSSSESYVCFLSISIVNISINQPTFRIEYDQLNLYMSFSDYFVENNTWIHFGVSFSSAHFIDVYFNGKQMLRYDETRLSLLLYNPRLTVTIGGSYFDDLVPIKPTNYASRKCFAQNPEFNFTQLYGEIDDLKMFARALTDDEFADLANSTNKTSPL